MRRFELMILNYIISVLNRLTKLLIPLFLIFSFVLGQNKKPNWITQTPSNPNFYNGIGVVDKKGKSVEEYREKANQIALGDISRQINTTISSTFEDNWVEGTGISKEEVKSMLKSTSYEVIEGAKKIDDFEDKKQYWVYWQLDIRKHKKNTEKYIDLSKEFFKQANNTIPNVEIVEELSYLVKSYEAIYKTHGKLVWFGDGEQKQLINTEIPNRIEKIINNLNTNAKNTQQAGKNGQDLNRDLIFEVNTSGFLAQRVKGLPVEFKVVIGKMNLDERTSTDSDGIALSKVKILSDVPNQSVRAIIDLKYFKQYKAPNVVFDEMLDEIAANKKGIYFISVSDEKNFDIAVKLLSETGISSPEISNLTDKFVTSIINQTKLKVMERQMIDDVLEEQGFNTECSTDECLIEINKITPVDKMIFVILNGVAESAEFIGEIVSKDEARIFNKEFGWTYKELKPGEYKRFEAGEMSYRGTIKLTDIVTGNIQGSLDIKHKGTMDQLLDNNMVNKWIADFYSSINLPVISFTSSLNNIQVFKNEEYWKDIPILEEELEPDKKYKIQFVSPGFETETRKFSLNLGQTREEKIELERKTKRESFLKSVMLPGYGQWYSSDNTHNNRRVTGTIFAVAYLGSLIGTGLTWSEYFASKTDYNNSVDAYNDQEVMTEIDSYRTVMEDNHADMASAKSTAGLMTGILATVWISSAVEAWLRFPTDYGSSVSFSYDPILNTKRLSVSMNF